MAQLGPADYSMSIDIRGQWNGPQVLDSQSDTLPLEAVPSFHHKSLGGQKKQKSGYNKKIAYCGAVPGKEGA